MRLKIKKTIVNRHTRDAEKKRTLTRTVSHSPGVLRNKRCWYRSVGTTPSVWRLTKYLRSSPLTRSARYSNRQVSHTGVPKNEPGLVYRGDRSKMFPRVSFCPRSVDRDPALSRVHVGGFLGRPSSTQSDSLLRFHLEIKRSCFRLPLSCILHIHSSKPIRWKEDPVTNFHRIDLNDAVKRIRKCKGGHEEFTFRGFAY